MILATVFWTIEIVRIFTIPLRLLISAEHGVMGVSYAHCLFHVPIFSNPCIREFIQISRCFHPRLS